MGAAAGICARRMQMYHAEGLSVRKIDYDVRITAPAAIRELRAAGCEVSLDDDVTADSRDDARVLRTWRAMCPELQDRWPEAARPEDWEEVWMENGRVVKLELEGFGLTGAVPAEIGRLSALRLLSLADNELTSVPAEIGLLASLECLDLGLNQLTRVPAEIGQLASLEVLWLYNNKLTSLPTEIGQLTSLRKMSLTGNQLTSVPMEIWQLTSLTWLDLDDNLLTSLPAEIGQLTSLTYLKLIGFRVRV